MNGSTHLVIGIASGFGLALSSNSQPVPALVLVGAAALGGLLPDIDTAKSKIRRTSGTGWIPSPISHRGITHSLLAVVLIYFAATSIAPLGGVALTAGYISHLLADGVTKGGIPLLWPLGGRWRLLPRFIALRNGGILESAVLGLSFVACLGMFVQLAFEVWRI